jgi:membrane-associated protease RseP (regulator of RpoE activity)
LPASRALWWLYIIAISFLGYLALHVYLYLWGPELVGFHLVYTADSVIVGKLSPESAGARAGLRVGDRLVAVNGIPMRAENGRLAWILVAANFEPGLPIPMNIERGGKQNELTVILRRRGLGDSGWLTWQALGSSPHAHSGGNDRLATAA